jgi:acetylornithine/succinyldiaminopimelate/putrescine aminotransferase
MRRVSEYFFAELRDLQRQFSFIREVRGAGFMIGVELDFPCKHLVNAGIEQGLLFNVTHDTVIRMLPPYILTEKEAARALAGLRKVFRAASPAPAA